jgi:hypothetical protein
MGLLIPAMGAVACLCYPAWRRTLGAKVIEARQH